MQVVSELFVSDVYRQFGGAVSLGCGGCGRGRLLGLKYNARSNFLVLLISGDLLTATAHGSVRVLLRSESTLNDDPNRGVVHGGSLLPSIGGGSSASVVVGR
ncbi:hypothetical protein F2Q69_00019966 [Brassica cretica]|uniref:Uncharacterized protein n=1 Tax=Brassica cretica TaxID=69181 RepID=A0A8S9QK26_BRACR|nr:hypothetical protein F2Q69_00019966 [Brassica cretica]